MSDTKRLTGFRSKGKRLVIAVLCIICSVVFLLSLHSSNPLSASTTRPSGSSRIFELSSTAERLGHYLHKQVPAETVTITVTTVWQAVPTTTTSEGIEGNLLRSTHATPSFRENLRPELKYVSSWPAFGWVYNQVIESMNLLYLALITERVPIIPAFSPFTSSHVKSEEYIEFSEVFDLPHLEKMMKTKILEWHEVKDPYSETMEPLGCWNLEKLSSEVMVLSVPPANLNLDISYTTPPKWTKAYPDNPSDPQTKFWSLATLGFSDTQPDGLIPEASLVGQKSLPADQQLLCFDNLLFVCAHEPWELGKMYSPVWRFVGQHMRWHERIQTIANDYIRQALGVEADSTVPPYVVVHIRRGDFREQCLDLDPSICLAPLLLYEIQVEAVKEELLAMKGIKVDHVFVTSDEEDPSWWETVYERGWKTLDHSAILTQHGPWYPVFVDAVLGSGAVGFVGTYTSTVSMLAMIRVAAWNNGVNRSVRWGHHMTQEDLTALTKQQ